MRKILNINWRKLRSPVYLAIIAAVAIICVYLWFSFRFGRAISYTSSVVSENSPIAELATRKIVWRVVHLDSSVSKDTFRDTIYTIKVGYDLTAIEIVSIDKTARTVTLALPPPKIMSVDDMLQRNVIERKTILLRLTENAGEDGKADREDIASLAADCEKFHLLETDSLRESLKRMLARQLKDASGYELVLEDGLEIPAKALFNAYFDEKGISFRL